jgi:hypothetical protein
MCLMVAAVMSAGRQSSTAPQLLAGIDPGAPVIHLEAASRRLRNTAALARPGERKDPILMGWDLGPLRAWLPPSAGMSGGDGSVRLGRLAPEAPAKCRAQPNNAAHSDLPLHARNLCQILTNKIFDNICSKAKAIFVPSLAMISSN